MSNAVSLSTEGDVTETLSIHRSDLVTGTIGESSLPEIGDDDKHFDYGEGV